MKEVLTKVECMKQRVRVLMTTLICMICCNISAHDIAAVNANGMTIYYNWINEKTELEVTYPSRPISSTYAGDVVIPESVEYEGKKYPVTAIGASAFQYEIAKITSIYIPSSITNFNRRDNRGYTGLASIIVAPENPKYDSRDNCNAIIETETNTLILACNNTVIPNNVTSIGENAFSRLNIISITIPNSVTCIGEFAFGCCKNLRSISIPNSVTAIGNSAFRECDSLTSVDIPNSVTQIPIAAFYACSSLSSVTIPNSVTCIDDAAFHSCRSLISINIPNSVTRIGRSAFVRCDSLTSVTIPNGVTSIENSTFRGCTNLTSVDIPNSVTLIDTQAFQKCTSLTSVTIPDKVATIGYQAFQKCTSLTSVTIPDKVATIGYQAFQGDKQLENVVLGSGVTSIGGEAFSGCKNVREFNIKAQMPPVCDSKALNDIDKDNCLLCIPEGCLSAYLDADQWKDFHFIKDGDNLVTGIERYTGLTMPVQAIYDLQGRIVTNPQPGHLYIHNGKKKIRK